MKRIVYFVTLLLTSSLNAQIVTIPDPNFKAALVNGSITFDGSGTPVMVDTNGNGEIEVSEAENILNITIYSTSISSFVGIESFPNLIHFASYGNSIENLNVTNLNFLESLIIAPDVNLPIQPITSFTISNLPQLNDLEVSIADADVDLSLFSNLRQVILRGTILNLNLQNLSFLEIANFPSSITSLNISGCPLLENISSIDGNLNEFITGNNGMLRSIDIQNSPLSQLDLTGMNSLEFVTCINNQLTTVITGNLPQLKHFFGEYNQIQSLDFSNCPLLELVSVWNNSLTSLSINNLTNLINVNAHNNQLTSIDLSNCIHLTEAIFNSNALLTVVTDNCQNLDLYLHDNPYTSLTLSNILGNAHLILGGPNMVSFNFNNVPNLSTLSVTNSPLINEIDISRYPALCSLNIENCLGLTQLNVKNGAPCLPTISSVNPNEFSNLNYVCCDLYDIGPLTNFFSGLGYQNLVVHDLCNTLPGALYNTLEGTFTYDLDANGCDAFDWKPSNLRLNINSNVANSAVFSNSTGAYTFYPQAGNYTLTPVIDNPELFTITPSSTTLSFTAASGELQQQNFCITPLGTTPDLVITITPINPARPGFESTYRLTYKNKGNQTMSEPLGVILAYPSDKMDFSAANVTPNEIITGMLKWDYFNLLPFETRTIELTFQMHGPNDTFPTNDGDVLLLNAMIAPIPGDHTTIDNQNQLKQTVLNSFDPNNIICIEGQSIDASRIGDYLNYCVRFENTGTAPADRVIVQELSNPLEFNTDSYQFVNASHPCEILLRNNRFLYRFDSINLLEATGNPPVGGHGDILFRIRTVDNLVGGDSVVKNVKIFFDYNLPLQTNDTETVFSSLHQGISTWDQSVKVFPNPATTQLQVEALHTLQKIEWFDAQGRILEQNFIHQLNSTLDISMYSKGLYIIRVTTIEGSYVAKIKKE